MPPGQTIPMDLSYAVAKKICTTQDLERLACAYLSSTATVNFDAEKAAREFGGVKPGSFKRAIWVITKKIKDHQDGVGGGDGDGEDEHGVPVTPKAKAGAGAGKKRKTPTSAVKSSSAKKGKKARDEDVGDVKREVESTAAAAAVSEEDEQEDVLF